MTRVSGSAAQYALCCRTDTKRAPGYGTVSGFA
ncbi:hypothetical protein a10_06329 [Streptomyces acidiscabies]|nr:hypothetical protein a10_06329 [Streptomyces acidiscabies]GAV41111.1 hypothetical protein Saa2_04014 [Streptomyces acidiscabies]